MSSIQEELEQLGSNPTLEDLESAIARIQSSQTTRRNKIRAADRFLGAAAEQLGLPGLYTLPNGNKFVPAGEDRSRGSTGVDDARYLARVGLLPAGARERIESNFAWNADFEPLPQAETDVGNRPPREERRMQNSGTTINANINDVRNGPYVDYEINDVPTRVYGSVEILTQFADEHPYTVNDIVDPDAPQDEPGDNDAQDGAGTNSGNDGSDAEDNDTDDTDSPEQEIYQSLEDFATSNLGGLRNDRNQEPAIRELQTFLSTELGLDTGGVDGRYGPRTTAAVRRFQSALTDVVQDGDAGPETIGKIQELRTDMERMQELLDALNQINDSVIPVRFKSGLAQLLERDLTQEERTELEQLINKYEDFRQEFPEFNSEIFVAADQAIQSGGVSQAATREPTSTISYDADTSVEDLKLPVEGGQGQQTATNAYNALIDEGEFEEAANMLRDDEALGVPPEGLESELRRRARGAETLSAVATDGEETAGENSQEVYIPNNRDIYHQDRPSSRANILLVKNRNSNDEFWIGRLSSGSYSLIDTGDTNRQQTSITAQELQTANPTLFRITQGWFNQTPFTGDLQQDMRTLLLSPDGSRVQQFLQSINLDSLEEQQFTQVTTSLRNLSRIMMGDQRPPNDVQGGTIMRFPSSAYRPITDFIRNDLAQAQAGSLTRNGPAPNTSTPEGKAQALYSAMRGIGADAGVVRSIMLAIQNQNEFNTINQEFIDISGGEGLWPFIQSQSSLGRTRDAVRAHLEELGINLNESVNNILNMYKRISML